MKPERSIVKADYGFCVARYIAATETSRHKFDLLPIIAWSIESLHEETEKYHFVDPITICGVHRRDWGVWLIRNPDRMYIDPLGSLCDLERALALCKEGAFQLKRYE